MAANSQKKGLKAYRAKRSADRTPEPFGSDSPRAPGAPSIFVVQKHAARRLHYDFRLELGGVLVSWAVPRGPTLDPKERRLAVHVENHPLDYADFEGVIPEGNYGAGPVIVWDRGTWSALEDPETGLEAGSLKFELQGFKLRGEFTLVRTREGSEWLLIKKADRWADPGGERELSEESVLSGLTLEEMAEGPRRAERIRGELERLGAPRRQVSPASVRLMQAERREEAFSDPGWIYELKYDGFRLLSSCQGGEASLRYRRGLDATALYPEVAVALCSLPYDSLIIDGEVVVFDAEGRSDFGRLQKRAMLSRARDIRAASLSLPATLLAFDLLAFEGYDLRGLPLLERKRLLSEVLPSAGVLRYSDHIEERGEEFAAKVAELGLEGIMAKKADSPYRGRRSSDWIKVRNQRTEDFAVVGYTPPKRSRQGFGGLHLAAREGERWVYAGRVGSGFSAQELSEIRERLDALPRRRYDFEDLAIGSGHVWVEPELVVEVRFSEWKHGRLLRQPTFLRSRPDKAPAECHAARQGPGDEPPRPAKVEEEPAPGHAVALSNLDKVFWPEEGYTKGDLIEYYRAVSPWLLPYLADRPVVLTRYPDGIEGKSFYQKDAPEWVPDWIRTERVWSEHSARDIHYFVCEDVESLVYLVNLGTIPLHVWSSRASDLAHPDWCILDLDPKGAPWADVVTCARAIRKLCRAIELECMVKTSGSTGLHVLIPLGRQLTYEQSRNLAGLVARVIESEHRDIATTARTIQNREGKVYLDWLQNRHGQLLVAPFSVRPLPGAPVSMPLRWSEVSPRLDHRRFTIKSAVRRMKRLKEDPIRPVLEIKPDLLAALGRLSERLHGELG